MVGVVCLGYRSVVEDWSCLFLFLFILVVGVFEEGGFVELLDVLVW